MSKTADLKQVFKDAQNSGDLSQKSMQVLTGNLDLGAQIQAGLGIAAEDVQASEVVLVSLLIDDSGSIRFGNNAQLVRDGHNTVLDSLQQAKAKEGVLIATSYLNGTVLYPYRKIDDADKMDAKNFNPNGSTPLYDRAIVLCGQVIAKTKEFEDNGIPVRTISCIVTDGADQGSRATARDAKNIIEDLLRREKHIVAGMGIEDGTTDFKQVFSDMGIRAEWILTPKNSDKEIRKAFQLFSQSAVRASQNAASFSKTALGGFATP